MSDQRLTELERWRATTQIALEQLSRDLEARSARDDVERGRLFASLAKQLRAVLDQIEPLRLELESRLEAQQKYDDLNELRFDLLRSEIRRLDQQQRESERDSWHETTGLRELEELSAQAREQRSIAPPAEPRRRRNTPAPAERSGKHAALELQPAPPAAPPPPPPPATLPPATTAQAGVQLARIVFADSSVSVRFVAVLTLLVVALTVLLLALRSALPMLIE